MLEKQVGQEYDLLTEQIRDNSYNISSQGENVNVTKEDPIAPVEVLANNVRDKLKRAQDEVEEFNGRVGNVMKKVSEKKALLGSHKQRHQLLLQKKSTLLSADGGVQKIASTIRALMRYEKDNIDSTGINEDSTPQEGEVFGCILSTDTPLWQLTHLFSLSWLNGAVLNYLQEQINDYSKYEEKPEDIAKIMKRFRKMVRGSGR